MERKLPLFIIVTLLIGYPLVATAASFDFFYLVLMWPGAYCQQSTCCVPKTGLPANDFLVRGLWTYDSTTGEQVTRCKSSNFYIDDLAELKDGLYKYWSNLKCPSNDGKSTWRSAWKNYGVCSNMTEFDYFKTALQLRADIDLLSLLAKKGIVPDSSLYKLSDIKRPDDSLYKLSDIKSAIAEGIGSTPQIRCSVGPKDQFQLYEVYVCVSKDGSTIIDCPIDQKFTCSEEILFHPFNYSMINGPATISTGVASSARLLPKIEMVV